jgi:hypothetical protein
MDIDIMLRQEGCREQREETHATSSSPTSMPKNAAIGSKDMECGMQNAVVFKEVLSDPRVSCAFLHYQYWSRLVLLRDFVVSHRRQSRSFGRVKARRHRGLQRGC